MTLLHRIQMLFKISIDHIMRKINFRLHHNAFSLQIIFAKTASSLRIIIKESFKIAIGIEVFTYTKSDINCSIRS